MYDFDTVSLIFGICCGVVPTVIIMTIANMADDLKPVFRSLDAEEQKRYIEKSDKWKRKDKR